jgi:hypothetical protein
MNNEDKEFYELTMKLLEAAEAVIQQDSATNREELRAAAYYLRMHPNSKYTPPIPEHLLSHSGKNLKAYWI